MDRGPELPPNENGGRLAQPPSAAFADQMGTASSSDEEEDAMLVTAPVDDNDNSALEEEGEIEDVRASAARLLRQVSLALKKRRTKDADLESSIQALLEAHSSGPDSASHPSNTSKDVGEEGNVRANAARLLRQVSLAQHRRRGTDAVGDLESSISVLLEVHASMHAKDGEVKGTAVAGKKPLKVGPSLPAIQDEEAGEEEESELRESTGRNDDGVRADAARLLRQASTRKAGGTDDGTLESSIKALLVAHASEGDGTVQAANDVGGNVAEGERADDAGVRAGAERLLRRVRIRGGNFEGGDLGAILRALLEVHNSMREGDEIAPKQHKKFGRVSSTNQDKEGGQEEEELHESIGQSKPSDSNLREDISGTMSFLVVKVRKPDADSKLGFAYSTVNGCTTITSVEDGSLFGGTGLEAGQTVLTINGSRADRIGVPAVQALLESLGEGEVTIVVEKPPGASEKAGTFEYKVDRNVKTRRSAVRSELMAVGCPRILGDAGVPEEKWTIVRSLIVTKLMPASLKCVEAGEAYSHLPSTYNDFIRQSKGMEVSMMHSNTAIVSVSVNNQINSILGKYGVVAVLEYEPYESINKELMMIPKGFAFHAM